MAFDKSTRNRLASFVGTARNLLADEFTQQFQSLYGISDKGVITSIEQLRYLDDPGLSTAILLRERIDYLVSSHPDDKDGTKGAVDRLAREQAFTVLNRLAAVRMAEKRDLVVESVGKGYQSKGFQVFEQVAGSGLGETYQRYSRYLFCLFDELAVDLGVLFDRRSPQGLLFPRESALQELLKLLNAPDLDTLWVEDETIGWIYQYYNDPAERKKMREYQAPRNSRELAVRNQFFTPRYVVEFLTDNTLGCIWYEMTQGQTRLKDQCRYLVRRPTEIFLNPGDTAPDNSSQDGLSQEELLKQPVYIPHRPLKDPRDIRMLDPACGSMHFGLYAFDLFEIIYDEAWELEEQLGTDALSCPPEMKSLHDTYDDKDTFLQDVPRLIVENNLHGIDIDPRATQIAGLSLWLRAQRSWHQQGLRPQERPCIRRSNIVCAEPMPGDETFLEEFIATHLSTTAEGKLLGQLVRRVFDVTKLAGEAGSLLKAEEEIAGAVIEAKEMWLKWIADPKMEQGRLFSDNTPRSEQLDLRLDVSGITDKTFWEKAEEHIYAALQTYTEHVEHSGGYQRRLFADDAANGFSFIDLCRQRYDTVLMNPPFGAFVAQSKNYISRNYSRTKNDLYAAFVEKGLHCLNDAGRLGAITSRTGFFLGTFQQWREKILLGNCHLLALADLGSEVLDGAVVEVASYILEKGRRLTDSPATVFRLLTTETKAAQLESAISGGSVSCVFYIKPAGFRNVETSPFAYWIPDHIRACFGEFLTFEPAVGDVRCGLSTNDNPRFVRALWEVSPQDHFFCYYPTGENRHFCSFDDPVVQSFSARRLHGERIWSTHVMAGTSQPWFSPMTVVVNWKNDGEEIKAYARVLGNSPSRNVRSEDYYFRPGISWTRRAVRMVPYIIPSNSIPTASRYMAFPNDGLESLTLGFMASNFTSAYVRMFGEWFTRPNFLVDNLKSLPWSTDLQYFKEEMEFVVKQEVTKRRMAYRGHEPFHEFVMPFGLTKPSDANVSFNYESLLGEQLDTRIGAAYHLSHSDFDLLQRDVQEAVSVRNRAEVQKAASGSKMSEDDEDDSVLNTTEPAIYETNLSYGLGVALGRWDIRFATGEKPVPELPDPFAPLPVCPPGQLQNEHGLPITKEELEELKNDGQWNYPIEIPWDGILVDDPGHPLDIEARVHQGLQIIW